MRRAAAGTRDSIMRLALFDVDGTLILTGGAGMRALYRALRAVLKVNATDGIIRPDGKTDPCILKELLAHFNMTDRWSPDVQEALLVSYLGFLEDEMSRARERGLIKILPGVRDLLDELSAQPDFALGLVTGNLEKGSRIKLDAAGLELYFHFGGYGSDSEDRTQLTKIGIQRGTLAVAPEPVERAFVIGDTPLDIHHGHAAGASVIAVASGGYNLRDLAAHRPDLLVPDLTATRSIIAFMRRDQGSHK